ncbi:hypothetical protein DSECCO2_659570 [anaerobic digester metagenome]
MFSSHSPGTFLSEQIVFFVRCFRRTEERHILNNSQNRYIHLLIDKHIECLAGVCQSHFLGGRHNDDSGHTVILHQCEMNITRSRRRIENQIIEFTPFGIVHDLRESTGNHRTAPDQGFGRIGKKSHRNEFHSEFFERNNLLFSVFFNHLRMLILYTKHQRNAGSVNVSIHQSNLCTTTCKACSQIHSNR